MAPPTEDQEFVERAIDRAVAGVHDLLRAELRTIAVELRAINQRLERVDTLAQTVDGLDTRLTSAEAFISSHERRLNDAEPKVAVALEVERRLTAIEGGRQDLRAWLWNHLPSLVVGVAGFLYVLLH